ncbi:twin-arginine translocation pathway signal [Bordetella genomosp. 7]|jgi:lipid-binding SYLF domain-containing protein|uniref:Twin-arginine translocation pathway signal n=1 Tax=Bordetella genomosp. 7 TaxID=1416805 RepID=A0A261RJ73_9BORD|nr:MULTISPECIES: YSC84-related protein [Bordetella]OZI24288.1 twin-arginine translocation pathway signal [Bordetella genomosp. 7]OZI25094.1 twin-arginine translocation pathway signal [Bordetella genomosp. 7]
MVSTQRKLRRTALAAMTLAFAGVAFTGCTVTSPHTAASAAEQRDEINSGADATLTRLYETSPQAKDLVARAKGVLIFPSVLSASFVVGAEHGKGVLRVGGSNAGYFSTTGGSIGFQAGAQSKAIVLLFMTDDALQKFRNSNGWTVGADATVAVANIGANGNIDSNTVRQPIVGFVMNNAGLMAGVSIDGTKIAKLDL